MLNTIRIAIAQINPLLGDIEGNASMIIQFAKQAKAECNADIIVYPELALIGYPPEDLLLRDECRLRCEAAMKQIQNAVPDLTLVIGHPVYQNNLCYNAASVIRNGSIALTYFKQQLPNYAVFDEKRYFTPGDSPAVFTQNGHHIGLIICEDLWEPNAIANTANAGADLILCLNASPFHLDKLPERLALIQHRQKTEADIPIAYVNLVGGQDELVFDGGSIVVGKQGKVIKSLPLFKECIDMFTYPFEENITMDMASLPPEAALYNALVMGTRDYVLKNRFPGVLIGLSGGIDSALTLCIAVDALGADKVRALLLPSRYTSNMSLEDALTLAQNANVQNDTISIEPTFQALLSSLSSVFTQYAPDVTEENMQARCRGILLMAVSNKTGKLVLTTGNKSEMAVGYSTLYGDMAGGFAPLKDLTKTQVFALTRYRNTLSPLIPTRIISRPPTAELRDNQLDQDSLPPYDKLDPILIGYVENNLSMQDLIAAGYEADYVKRVIHLIDKNEYKRRQSPPGVRVSRRAFGRDWRYPITSGFGKKS